MALPARPELRLEDRAQDGISWQVQLERGTGASEAKVKRLDFLLLALGRLQRLLSREGGFWSEWRQDFCKVPLAALRRGSGGHSDFSDQPGSEVQETQLHPTFLLEAPLR